MSGASRNLRGIGRLLNRFWLRLVGCHVEELIREVFTPAEMLVSVAIGRWMKQPRNGWF